MKELELDPLEPIPWQGTQESTRMDEDLLLKIENWLNNNIFDFVRHSTSEFSQASLCFTGVIFIQYLLNTIFYLN